MLSTDQRKPDCSACPFNAKVCIPGDGDLNSEILILAEGPGGKEMEAGQNLVGWSGSFVWSTLQYYGISRKDCRVENVFCYNVKYSSSDGKKAASVCGRTIWDVIRQMPNLRTAVVFGEAALRELSGFREWDETYKAQLSAHKKYLKQHTSWQKKCVKEVERHAKARAKWEAKHDKLTAKLTAAKTEKQQAKACATRNAHIANPPIQRILDEPTRVDSPSPTRVGAKGITDYRGSPLWVKGYEGLIRLFGVIHPAACAPKRQPRLRPLIMHDIRRAVEFHKGTRAEQIPVIASTDSAAGVQEFIQDMPPGRIALDIEWSRKQNEIVTIQFGTDKALVIVFAKPDGWRMPTLERGKCFAALQSAFDDPRFQWGGHFINYDEGKLASIGLQLCASWDSLYGFHILYSELGSARDEEEELFGKAAAAQATGYGLGFVVSVLCLAPEHKILTDDLRYIPLQDVQIGQRILAFEENRIPGKRSRKYCVAEVTEKAIHNKVGRYEVKLDNGQTFLATRDHLWLARNDQGRDKQIKWIPTYALRIGHTKILRPFDVWDFEESWEAGNVAGFLNGEGSLCMQGGCLQLSYYQNPGPTLDEIRKLISSRGFTFSSYQHGPHKCIKDVLTRSYSDIARFLGTFRPSRLMAKFRPERFGYMEKSQWVGIESITYKGVGPVVALKTTSNTMIVDGVAHHNCDVPHHKGVVTGTRDALSVPTAELVEYAGRDVATSWWAIREMDREGSKTMPNGLFDQEMKEELDLSRRAAKMGKRGVPIIDDERIRRLTTWQAKLETLAREAKTLVNSTAFNIGSGPQLAAHLEARGVKVRHKGDTGNAMLDGNELIKLGKKYPDEPLMKLALEYRKCLKEVSAYEQMQPGYDDMWHVSWKVHGTTSGRWSSTPNAQNLSHEQREVIG